MTITSSVARPYAKAAFEFAQTTSDISRWSTALRVLSVAVADSQMQALLSNPAVSKDQAAEFLVDILKAESKAGIAACSESIENFVRLLAENKRLFALPAIASLFQADVAKNEGYVQLAVTSAFTLNESQRKEVETRMAKQLNSDVKVTYQEDPQLIGGMIVRSGDWVLDDSIRGRLARLQSALI